MKVIILAGGSGTRLWPLSRSNYPKQFLRLVGEESFFQKTIRRNHHFDEIFIVTGEPYYDHVCRQVHEIDPELEANIILEPTPRNTAPAIAFALGMIEADPEDLFLVVPADHMIAPEEKYYDVMREAETLARERYLVTFGVRPTRPETGYGYIRAKGRNVEAFVEKPDLKTAQGYLESGEYYWNSGMFAFSAETFQEEVQKYCPDIMSEVDLSIDYALMEKSDRVAMVPLDLTWSDIGSWENLYDVLEKDASQNVTKGDVMAIETQDSLILAENRMIATIGLKNMLVIESDDVVLVADKSQSQRVKEIVARLKHLGKKEVEEHLTVHRPWGSYTVLMEGQRYKIKRIFVKPLQKLSLQMHYHRSEHWVVVTGTAKVTVNDQIEVVHEGESIFVPKSAVHRVENPGKVPLEIIEVQVGEYLGEDDIIRFEDIYGRPKRLLSN